MHLFHKSLANTKENIAISQQDTNQTFLTLAQSLGVDHFIFDRVAVETQMLLR